jgi:hypothetical protein
MLLLSELMQNEMANRKMKITTMTAMMVVTIPAVPPYYSVEPPVTIIGRSVARVEQLADPIHSSPRSTTGGSTARHQFGSATATLHSAILQMD